jgi:hypothetical protein
MAKVVGVRVRGTSCGSPPRDPWQEDATRVVCVVIDGVAPDLDAIVMVHGGVEHRAVGVGELDPDAVSGLEDPRGRPYFDVELVDVTWLERLDCVVRVKRPVRRASLRVEPPVRSS